MCQQNLVIYRILVADKWGICRANARNSARARAETAIARSIVVQISSNRNGLLIALRSATDIESEFQY